MVIGFRKLINKGYDQDDDCQGVGGGVIGAFIVRDVGLFVEIEHKNVIASFAQIAVVPSVLQGIVILMVVVFGFFVCRDARKNETREDRGIKQTSNDTNKEIAKYLRRCVHG